MQGVLENSLNLSSGQNKDKGKIHTIKIELEKNEDNTYVLDFYYKDMLVQYDVVPASIVTDKLKFADYLTNLINGRVRHGA